MGHDPLNHAYASRGRAAQKDLGIRRKYAIGAARIYALSFIRHCERSAAIQPFAKQSGLLRFARNDGKP